MPKVLLKRTWRITVKNINVLGENAKSILPYMEHTPIGIKLRLSRRLFDQNKKVNYPKYPHSSNGKKTSHGPVPSSPYGKTDDQIKKSLDQIPLLTNIFTTTSQFTP
jgi:hypothetical protein